MINVWWLVPICVVVYFAGYACCLIGGEWMERRQKK